MTGEVYKSIISECKCIAYYLPSISTEVSPEVAEEIETRLTNIERLSRHMHDSEMSALRNMVSGGHSSHDPSDALD